MALLKNTKINDTGIIRIPKTKTIDRIRSQLVIRSFTTVGTTSWIAPPGVNSVEVLVVAGGGSGGGVLSGGSASGGGGAGGLIYNPSYSVIPGNSYTVTVGAGGVSIPALTLANGNNGQNSVFDTLTAIGGGGGGCGNNVALGSGEQNDGLPGGSGGGAGGRNTPRNPGGLGTPGQGFAGGTNAPGEGGGGSNAGGGGGGAGGPGNNAESFIGGNAGIGLEFSISGSSIFYAGGGGGGVEVGIRNGLGQAGGGDGGAPGWTGASALPNTGSGGGGTRDGRISGAGGSGIVILKYQILDQSDDYSGAIIYNDNTSSIEISDNLQNVGWNNIDSTINSASHNRLRHSEDFTQVVHVKNDATISANSIVAPNYTSTGSKFIPGPTLTSHYILQDSPIEINQWHVGSIYAKAGELRYLQAAPSSGFLTAFAWINFDLITGTFSVQGTNDDQTSGQMINEGNGWYRCVTIVKSKSTTNGRIAYASVPSLTSTRLEQTTGNSSDGFFIWGMQLEKNTRQIGIYTPTLESFTPEPLIVGNQSVHRFTQTGRTYFIPSSTGTVEVLVVGGGGGGGSGGGAGGGGGGGGGVLYESKYPLVSGRPYLVEVGSGGAGSGAVITPNSWQEKGFNGGNSRFGNLVALGGGGGGSYSSTSGGITYSVAEGVSGGSGGGGGLPGTGGPAPGGPGTFGQGTPGGIGSSDGLSGGGGGGGAGSPGGNGSAGVGGNGGIGLPVSITGKIEYYGGGGGGGTGFNGAEGGPGGLGGGGRGERRNVHIGDSGTANTGGGGGGNTTQALAPSGGSGVVIVRYKNS